MHFDTACTSGFVQFYLSQQSLTTLLGDFKLPVLQYNTRHIIHCKEPPPMLLYSKCIQPGGILIKNQLFRLSKIINIYYEKSSAGQYVIPPRTQDFCFQCISTIDFNDNLPDLYHFKGNPINTIHERVQYRFPHFIQEHLFPPIHTL